MSTLKTNKISKNTGSAVIIGDGGSDTLSVNSTPTFIKPASFSDTLAVAANLTVTQNIIASANVGIGTSSPGELLEVSHATAPAIQLNRTNDGGFKSILRQQGNDFEIRGSSGSTKIYTGAADGDSSTTAMIIDASGHITKPLQTAFSAGRSSTLTDVAIDSFVTTNLNSEIYDVNSDFSDPNFTAPVTGKYQLSAVIYFNQLDASAGYYIIRISTSNRVYDRVINMAGRSDENYSSYGISVLADMDASDTAYVGTLQSGGSAQTDITAGTYFTGVLVC